MEDFLFLSEVEMTGTFDIAFCERSEDVHIEIYVIQIFVIFFTGVTGSTDKMPRSRRVRIPAL